MKRAVLVLLAILTASSLPLARAEKIDFAAIGRIILGPRSVTSTDHVSFDETVIAVFAYDAAMRDERLPRKALPAPKRGRESSE